MASDIRFNGTAGTFYSTVKPPDFSGTLTCLLHQTWGSRMAEISGRARGLAGSVWIPIPFLYLYPVVDIAQAATVSFPAGFFSFVPIVEASVLLPAFANTFDNGQWSIDHDKRDSGEFTLPKSSYLMPIHQAPVYMRLRAISTTGFMIESSLTRYGASLAFAFKELVNNEQLLIYWHCFGC